MESPVVIDKPPEYHGKNERGFPFDEEDASGAWSDLAARHPDIAARLRQRPSGWTTKRRPNSQDASDDIEDGFGARFPFDDIPPEFREHFPTNWGSRFQREEPQQTQPQPTQPHSPQQQSSATQTELPEEQTNQLPQFGLRNTVELGQSSAADAERAPRASSAPPAAMNHEPSAAAPPAPGPQPQAAVRHIPIFVEGRDEPVLPREATNTPPQTQPTFVPPPPPGADTDYFDDDFFPRRNVARAFGVPFGSNYRAGPQPFTHTKAFPQAAAARASPQREEYVKVPVHHERPETPTRQQRAPPPQQQQRQQPPQQQQRQPPQQQQQRPPPQQQQPPPQQHQPSPPPQKPQPTANDPITQILSIQTDVLNLMSEVENFTGSKKDKRYMYLDEMLTRNLIKLDTIETDGKENIRQARKEAIRCIQKCIAVLEAKAEKAGQTPQPQLDADMKEAPAPEQNDNAGDEEKEQTKENAEPQSETATEQPLQEEAQEPKPEDSKSESTLDNQTQPQPSDTRPDVPPAEPKDNLENKPQEKVEKKSPKKGKLVKKRDKSKDNKETANSDKQENVENSQVQVENNKGDSQTMEVDAAASQ